VVEEYKFMLEKSQSFFAGLRCLDVPLVSLMGFPFRTEQCSPPTRPLRDLPQYENKQWQLYFQKTFEIYTKVTHHTNSLPSQLGLIKDGFLKEVKGVGLTKRRGDSDQHSHHPSQSLESH